MRRDRLSRRARSANPPLAKLIAGFEPVFAATDCIEQIGKLSSSLHLICARSSLTIPWVKAVADVPAAELSRPATRRAGGTLKRGRATH